MSYIWYFWMCINLNSNNHAMIFQSNARSMPWIQMYLHLKHNPNKVSVVSGRWWVKKLRKQPSIKKNKGWSPYLFLMLLRHLLFLLLLSLMNEDSFRLFNYLNVMRVKKSRKWPSIRNNKGWWPYLLKMLWICLWASNASVGSSPAFSDECRWI